MPTKFKTLQHTHQTLRIVRIFLVSHLQVLYLVLALSADFWIFPQDFHGNVNLTLVVETFVHVAEGTLAQQLDRLVSVGQLITKYHLVDSV